MTYHKVNTPIKYQREAAECSAVALWIILAYHKKYVPIDELRKECKVSRAGTKAVDMLKAARKYGLIAKAHKKGSIAALQKMKPPFVIFYNYNHSVVVEGITDEVVYLNEGGYGKEIHSLDSFDDGFTGLVFSFAPAEDFKKERQKLDFGILKEVRDFFKPQRKKLAFTLLFGFLFSFVSVWILKDTFDIFLLNKSQNFVLTTGLLFGGIVFLNLKNRFLLKTIEGIFSKREKLMNRYFFDLNMNYFYQNGFKSASFLRHANQYISQHLPKILVAQIVFGSLAFTAFFFLIIKSVALVFLHLISSVCYFWILNKLWKINTLKFRDVFLDYDFSGADFPEYAAKFKRLKLSSKASSYAFSQISSLLHRLGLSTKVAEQTQFYKAIPLGLWIANSLFVVGFSLLQNCSLAAMSSLLILSLFSSWSLQQLVSLLEDLQFNYGLISEINRVTTQYKKEDKKDVKSVINLEKLLEKETVLAEMKQVRFDFMKDKEAVLKDFNLTIKQGEFVGILGKSGSGKSVISLLLTELHQVLKGEILFLGKPINQFSNAQKKQLIGLVNQDSKMFQGTIRENLTLWNTSISDETLQQVLKYSCLDSEITDLNQFVLFEARNFTKSQQQRLEIARVLVHQPKLLILDEATNFLSSQLENQLFNNLQSLNIACLFITHKAESLKEFDKVLTM